MSKDMDDIERVMDRTRANRVAKPNGGGGLLRAMALILILGTIGLGITALVAGINTII